MSTTAMWLLLAVVVIVIVFASVLYKRTFTVHELALTGVMETILIVCYLFFRVPFYGGSSFHLGNTFTALTAFKRIVSQFVGTQRIQLLVHILLKIDLFQRQFLYLTAVFMFFRLPPPLPLLLK